MTPEDDTIDVGAPIGVISRERYEAHRVWLSGRVGREVASWRIRDGSRLVCVVVATPVTKIDVTIGVAT